MSKSEKYQAFFIPICKSTHILHYVDNVPCSVSNNEKGSARPVRKVIDLSIMYRHLLLAVCHREEPSNIAHTNTISQTRKVARAFVQHVVGGYATSSEIIVERGSENACICMLSPFVYQE